ncbi:MAG: hypothetical protein ACK5KL_20990 [Dysgonomonas sp.]
MKNSKEIIQLDPKEKEVRQKLIDFAAAKRTIAYQALSNIADLRNIAGLRLKMKEKDDLEKISKILDRISMFELQEKRPMLSAIVVKANQNIQGDGFFKLCNDNEEDLKKLLKCEVLSPSINQRLKFSYARIEDCYDFWSNLKKFEANKGKDTHIE